MGYTRCMETTAGTAEAGSTPIFDELIGRFGIELPAEPTPTTEPTAEHIAVDETATA